MADRLCAECGGPLGANAPARAHYCGAKRCQYSAENLRRKLKRDAANPQRVTAARDREAGERRDRIADALGARERKIIADWHERRES